MNARQTDVVDKLEINVRLANILALHLRAIDGAPAREEELESLIRAGNLRKMKGVGRKGEAEITAAYLSYKLDNLAPVSINMEVADSMSVRDQFAAAALQGAIAAYGVSGDSLNSAGWESNIADWTYRMADAMMVARK